MRPLGKRTYIGLALLVFALTFFASSAGAFAAPTFNRPIDDDTHVANAISLSTTAFSSGVSAAVVTSGDGYADSLTAAVLAKAYSGPLLLSSATSLSADVASELARLKPKQVFLVGLPASFATGVKSAVSSLRDDDVVVLKGADRYETAALVAAAVKAKVGTVSKVVIAPGDSYAFALAASSLAAAQGWPLLLMPAAGPLPQSAKDAISDLGVSSGIVVGTDATLGVSGFTVAKRIVGTSSSGDSDGRYDTAADLAAYAAGQGWLSYAHLGIVSGEDYPDGEATVAFLAKDKGVLLFSKSSALQASTSAAIKQSRRGSQEGRHRGPRLGSLPRSQEPGQRARDRSQHHQRSDLRRQRTRDHRYVPQQDHQGAHRQERRVHRATGRSIPIRRSPSPRSPRVMATDRWK